MQYSNYFLFYINCNPYNEDHLSIAHNFIVKNHALYKKLLGETLYVQKADSDSIISSIHFAVLAKDVEERKKIIRALEENGIETRIFSAGNLGLHPFWFNRYGKTSFPMADRIYSCGFFLPNHPSLKLEDIEFISRVVLNSIK